MTDRFNSHILIPLTSALTAREQHTKPRNMTMPIEFEVHITESLLHRVMLRRRFRLWWLKLIAMALIGYAIAYDVRRGHWSTLSTVGVMLIAFLLLIYIAVYVRDRSLFADWKRQQGDAPVHYCLTEETISARSNLGSSELKWSVLSGLIEHRDCLLLGMGRTGHLTLPRADVPAEALAFIRKKFQSLNLPIRKY